MNRKIYLSNVFLILGLVTPLASAESNTVTPANQQAIAVTAKEAREQQVPTEIDYARAARKAFITGDYAKSREYYQQAIKLNAKIARFYLRYAETYSQSKPKTLESGQVKNFHNKQTKVQATEQDLAQAIAIIDSGLQQLPQHEGLIAAKAWYLNQQGKYKQTLELLTIKYSKALEPKALQNSVSLLAVADALLATGDITSAANYLEEYLKRNPKNSKLWLKACSWRLQECDKLDKENSETLATLEQANINCLHALAQDPASADTYYNLSNIYLQKKWYTHALWSASKALALNPKAKLASVTQENKYYFLAQIGSDEYSLEAQLPVDYSANESVILAIAADKDKANTSKLLAELRKINKAKDQEKLLEQFVLVNPNFPLGYYNRALLGLRNFKTNSDVTKQKIKQDLEKVISLVPKWFAGYSGLAAYYIQQKSYNKAKQLLAKATELNPNDDIVQFNINLLKMFDESVVASTLDELRMVKDAVKKQQASLENFDLDLRDKAGYLRRDPSSNVVYEMYGDIYAQSEDAKFLKQALDYYKKSLELGGDSNKLQAKMAAIRSD